jgi:hypothetical protein
LSDLFVERELGKNCWINAAWINRVFLKVLIPFMLEATKLGEAQKDKNLPIIFLL